MRGKKEKKTELVKTNRKIMDLRSNLTVIILYVNQINIPIEPVFVRMGKLKRKIRFNYMLFTRDTLNIKTY